MIHIIFKNGLIIGIKSNDHHVLIQNMILFWKYLILKGVGMKFMVKFFLINLSYEL